MRYIINVTESVSFSLLITLPFFPALVLSRDASRGGLNLDVRR